MVLAPGAARAVPVPSCVRALEGPGAGSPARGAHSAPGNGTAGEFLTRLPP